MGNNYNFNPRKLSTGKFSSGGNGIDKLFAGLILRDELKQKEEQRQPQVEYQSELAKRTAETASPRSVMRGTLIKAKQLADTVPPAPTGMSRVMQGMKNEFQGNVTQEIPQITEFHRLIDSTLTAFARTMYAEKGNVANWDIARVKKAFSDISWDTADTRALGWNRAIDTYNDVIGSYNSIDQSEKIDKKELLTPQEIGRARLLSGVNEYSDLSDDELEGVFSGPMQIGRGRPIVPRPMIEKAVSEYEKRGLHKKGKIQ